MHPYGLEVAEVLSRSTVSRNAPGRSHSLVIRQGLFLIAACKPFVTTRPVRLVRDITGDK